MKKSLLIFLIIIELLPSCSNKHIDTAIYSVQFIQSGAYTNFYRSIELGVPFTDQKTQTNYITPVNSDNGISLTTGGLMDSSYQFQTISAQPSFSPMVLFVYTGTDSKPAQFLLKIYKDNILLATKYIQPVTTDASNQLFTWTFY